MSLIKVLPIFPEFLPSYWSFRYALELVKKKAIMPPLGLITALAMLPGQYFDIQKVVDQNVRKVTDEEIKDADIIMSSAMIVQKVPLEELADRVHFFGKKFVVGGPYASTSPEEVSRYADHLVLGEAESGSLDAFISDLLNGQPKKIYKSGGLPSLDKTPLPLLDRIDLKHYTSGAIQFSRGCPYDCEFCDITQQFGRKPRTKSPEQMIREFDSLHKAGWMDPVFLVDDNFIGNITKIRELLPFIQLWQETNGYPFSLTTEASMNIANENNKDILEKMVNAGFRKVFVGIETNDQEALEKANKGQNLGKTSLLDKVETMQRYGLEVMSGFIIGLDGEKSDASRNMLNFIQESGIPTAMAGLLTALPGTNLYYRLQKEGRLLGESSGNNTHNLGFNFKTEQDEKKLIEDYKWLLKELYLNKENYWKRVRTLDSRRGLFHRNNSQIENGLRAAGILLAESVSVSPDFEFLNYLGKTALTHPYRIPEVIGRAAELRHFRIITENMLEVANYQTKTEKLYEDFRSRVEGLRGCSSVNWHKVVELEQRVLKNARRSYNKIHDDFKKDAQKYSDHLAKRISDFKERHHLERRTVQY
ncbi:MAG: radical SAM protein [Nanoarchaeota archaeon]